jgi:hypothetical protein
MRTKRSYLALLAMAALSAAGANASFLFNNLGDTVYVNSSLSGTANEGQSFTSGATSLIFDDLKLELDLYNGQTAGNGFLTVSLYSDSSNTPGTALDTIGVIDDSSLSATAAAIDLTPSFTLAPTTQYWIIITPSNSVAAWEASLPAGGDIGTSPQYVTFGGPVYPTNGPNPAFQMSVNADAGSSTPEPSSGLLLGTGLAAGAALFRKMRGTSR